MTEQTPFETPEGSSDGLLGTKEADTVHAPASLPTGTSQAVRRAVLGQNILLAFLSIVLALLVGALLIAASNTAVQQSFGSFHPMTTLKLIWEAVSQAYIALFKGAIYNPQAATLKGKLAPLSESLTIATPLALAGLAVAVPFRTGLFNIGVQGQIIAGSIVAGGIGFSWHLSGPLLLLCAVIGAIVGGAVYAGFAGWLKARTGAHEVITTIMLNYIALYFLQWLLQTTAFQRPGRNDPVSPIIPDNGLYPKIFGGVLRVHYGLFVALGAAVVVWWLFKYTTFGFKMRTVGANSAAARTAGINVGRTWIYAMVLGGVLAGLAASTTLLGTEQVLTAGIAGTLGFDAITVALLGKATPLGTVLAAFLFGALHAGGTTMQATTGVPVDIVLVLQAVIVLFIAAPPLVRSIFRLKGPAEGTLAVSKGWNG
jgi:simple sugar transport system permease protein